MKLNILELGEIPEEIAFSERKRANRWFFALAILLYTHSLSVRKTKRVLGWLGVNRSHAAI